MDISTKVEKPRRSFIFPVKLFIIGIPILLLLLSFGVISLIWVEVNKKNVFDTESKNINENLSTLDDIKFANAELTERVEVISDILRRDQNVSNIFVYIVSQITDRIIKVENLSKNFEGIYEAKVLVSSMKNGTDLFQKLSEIENLIDLKLESVQKLTGIDQFSFTISFKYKDGLSE